MGKFLGIDSSTQSITGLVIDTDKGELELECSISFDEAFSTTYPIVNGVIDLGAGQVHSPPLMWAEALDALIQHLRDLGGPLTEIEAVAGSGQQHGTVYLNETAAAALSSLDPAVPLATQLSGIFSRPTAPIWMDTSTAVQCKELEEGVGGESALLELTGNRAFERFSGPQVRKFYQECPDAYAATANISLVSSYVASLLAGRLVAVDPGDGSGTNMMDIRRRQWSVRATDATAPDLQDRLLPIQPATQVAGRISPYFVHRYGFSSDCLILPFSGDNPCSMIGLGLVQPGQVALSLGTSDTLFACMDQPRVSESGEGSVFASPDDVHYMALICFLNGSLAREAVRDRFGLDWVGFSEALRRTPAGNDGALMLPYFAPEIVPRMPHSKVVRQGLSEGDADANVRAVVEAQALSSKIHSRWMGIEIGQLSVAGGGSANREILQVYADVHGCPVHRFETTNAAALGAALRAAHSRAREPGADGGAEWAELVRPFTRPLAESTVRPNPGAVDAYRRMLPEFRALQAENVAAD